MRRGERAALDRERLAKQRHGAGGIGARAGEWRETLSTFSYRPPDSSYAYYGLRQGGATQALVGRLATDGAGWEFRGDEGTGVPKPSPNVSLQLTEARDASITSTLRVAPPQFP